MIGKHPWGNERSFGRAALSDWLSRLFYAGLLLAYAVVITWEFLHFGVREDITERLYINAFAVIALGVAEVYTRHAEARGIWRLLLTIGQSAALAAQIVVLLLIWPLWVMPNASRAFHPALLVGVWLGVVALGVPYAHALNSVYIKPGRRWIKPVALCTAALLGITIGISSMASSLSRIPLWLIAPAALHGVSLIILSGLYKDEAAKARKAIHDQNVMLRLTCPRCDHEQELPINDNETACESCGLLIHVRVEQPCCPNCGYLLYGYRVDACPECGRERTTGERAPARPEPEPWGPRRDISHGNSHKVDVKLLPNGPMMHREHPDHPPSGSNSP